MKGKCQNCGHNAEHSVSIMQKKDEDGKFGPLKAYNTCHHKYKNPNRLCKCEEYLGPKGEKLESGEVKSEVISIHDKGWREHWDSLG